MEKKSANGEMVKGRERERGEKMGPVVVEMSATGAAEMEKSCLKWNRGQKRRRRNWGA